MPGSTNPSPSESLLVIEDDTTVAEFIATLLRMYFPIEVHVAGSLSEAKLRVDRAQEINSNDPLRLEYFWRPRRRFRPSNQARAGGNSGHLHDWGSGESGGIVEVTGSPCRPASEAVYYRTIQSGDWRTLEPKVVPPLTGYSGKGIRENSDFLLAHRLLA